MSIVAPLPCKVPECDAPRYQRRSMCGSHYMKWYRYGDPRWVRSTSSIDLSGQRFGTLVAVERLDPSHWRCVCDCGRERRVRTFSLTSGGTSTCNLGHRRLAQVSYNALHQRLARDGGPAANYACVDCGSPARQWSYQHDDPDELIGPDGAYSLRSESYRPRCVPCHKAFDLDRIAKGARV